MNTRYFFFFIAAFVLAACTQIENPAESNVPVSLSYSTVAATETKAAQNLNEGTFTSGESVKVRISNTGAGSWTDYDFTTGDAGAMSPTGTVPYYPAGTQNIDIVAYYPATAGSSFSVATNQTADASYKASDLMFASVTNQAKQAEAVNLAFTHKMAKLNVNITAGTGVSSISSVSILNVKPTVSFDQATGAVGEATGDATAIAMSNEGAAVIPAQTIDGGLLSIETDKGTATYSVASKAFAAGNLYTLNITVNLRAVGTTTAITGWTSEGTVTVNPVMKDMTPEGVEAVDMGNGLKWANMNVGATTETGYGDYFAWGATKPFYVDHDAYGNAISGHWIDGKQRYDLLYYPFKQKESYNKYDINKYTFADGQTSGVWYSGSTFIGDNGDGVEHKDFASYDYVDDAARQNWGANWRTPTEEEWEWLQSNCSWEWTPNYKGTGVAGLIVTSNIDGFLNNSIFLPAAGCWLSDTHKEGEIISQILFPSGYYWSSSLDKTYSYYAGSWHFNSYGPTTWTEDRCNGLSIRPVTE